MSVIFTENLSTATNTNSTTDNTILTLPPHDFLSLMIKNNQSRDWFEPTKEYAWFTGELWSDSQVLVLGGFIQIDVKVRFSFSTLRQRS